MGFLPISRTRENPLSLQRMDCNPWALYQVPCADSQEVAICIPLSMAYLVGEGISKTPLLCPASTGPYIMGEDNGTIPITSLDSNDICVQAGYSPPACPGS